MAQMEDYAAGAMTVTVRDANALTADFDSVVGTFRPAVFRFALACLRDRDAAETIAQDCFLKAFNGRDAFRGDCGVKTWLMRIAVNLIRDHIRNRKLRFWRRTRLEPMDRITRRVDESPGANGQSPETLLVRRERVAALWTAVNRLPAKQRCVFLLRFVEDMNILEIATATGLKEGTVKTHLFRSLGTIRKRMESSI
jgi:RNA polymerase sigma-70 factor (ECF subfamily)